MKYALMLNMMLESNVENVSVPAGSPISTNRQEVVDWYNSLRVDPYSDGQWHKSFKRESPLEWYNTGDMEKDNDFFGGIYTFKDEAPDEAIRGYRLFK